MIKLLLTLISVAVYITSPLCAAADSELEDYQNHLELWKTEIEPDQTRVEQAGAIIAQGANLAGQIGGGCYHWYNASTKEKAELCSEFGLQMLRSIISAPVDFINHSPCTLTLIAFSHLYKAQNKLSASEFAYTFLCIQTLIFVVNIFERFCSVTERIDFFSQWNPIDEDKYSALHASDVNANANPLVKGFSVDTNKKTLSLHKRSVIKKIASLKFKRTILLNKDNKAHQAVLDSASHRRETGKLRVIGQPINYISCVMPFMENRYPNIFIIFQKINGQAHTDLDNTFIIDLERKINNIGNPAFVTAPNFSQLSPTEKDNLTTELKTRIYNAPTEYQRYLAKNWTAFITGLDKDCSQTNVKKCLTEFIDTELDTAYYDTHTDEINIMRTKYKVRNLTEAEKKRTARKHSTLLRGRNYFTDLSTNEETSVRIDGQKEKELKLIETYNRDVLVDLFLNQCHKMVEKAEADADITEWERVAENTDDVPVADYIHKYLSMLKIDENDIEAKVCNFMNKHLFLSEDISREYTFDYSNKLQFLRHLFEDDMNNIQLGADTIAFQELIDQKSLSNQGIGFEELKREYAQKNQEDQSPIGLWNFIQGKKRDLYLQVSEEDFMDAYLNEVLYHQSFSDELANPLLYEYKNSLDSVPFIIED